MNITYRELLNKLNSFTNEQLDMTATIYISDSNEFYGVNQLKITTDTDVLDENHPYLSV